MSTKSTYRISTSNAEETKSLAAKIGQRIKGGEIFVLSGDLGFGKTVFVKGLVAGAGINDEVSSPSFTISNLYSGTEFDIYHMDYYRIHEAGVLKDELLELIADKRNVLAIEWPNIVSEFLPENTIDVTFVSNGEENRNIEFSYTSEHDYIFKDLI